MTVCLFCDSKPLKKQRKASMRLSLKKKEWIETTGPTVPFWSWMSWFASAAWRERWGLSSLWWYSLLTAPGGRVFSLSFLSDSACVRRWRRSRSSSWSMISTVRSWWGLERSPATSHPSLASSRCSHNNPTPFWASWATAPLKASSPLGPRRYLPRPPWLRVDTAGSWWRSDSTR